MIIIQKQNNVDALYWFDSENIKNKMKGLQNEIYENVQRDLW